jgi:catechol 2,3-dioxygenase-like lactoylglutathione lyase family enzyme
MFKRIDHVEIVTDQLDRTVQFYTEVLGFTVKARDRIEHSGLGDQGAWLSPAFCR